MISIRKGCFETNSSSMHSMCIAKKAKKEYDDWNLTLGNGYNIDDQTKTFHLLKYSSDSRDAEFHRSPFRILDTSISKLRYLVGLFVRYKYHKDKKGHEAFEYFIEPEAKEQFDAIIKKATGCENVQYYYENFNGEHDYPDTSISNDSGEDVYHFMKRKNLSFEDVIFDPRITIQVDGDEYQEFKKLFDNNFIDRNAIEDISSGFEFWYDEDIWVDVKRLACRKRDCYNNRTYFDWVWDNMQGKTLIELDASEPCSETAWRKLRKLADIFNIKKFSRINKVKDQHFLKKYFPEAFTQGGNSDEI